MQRKRIDSIGAGAARPPAAPAGIVPEAAPTESFEALFPEPPAPHRPPGWAVWLVLLVLSAAAGIAGAAYAKPRLGELSEPARSTPAVNPEPSAVATAQPSAAEPVPIQTVAPTVSPGTPQAGVDPQAVTLRVLNGTAVAGAAAAAAKELTRLGFTVRDTGNARNRSYDRTIIYFIEGRRAEAEVVQRGVAGGSVLQQSDLAAPDMVLVVTGRS